MKRILMVVLLALLVIGSPAGAQEPPPSEFTDPCEPQAPATTDGPEVTPAWTDICEGWFTSSILDDVPHLELAIMFAGDLMGRPQDYSGSWGADGCRYQLLHQEGLGRDDIDVQGVQVHSRTKDSLNVTCGTPVERPCELGELNTRCFDYPPTRTFDLPDGAFMLYGDQLVWKIDFTGELAEFAEAHDEGSVLTKPLIVAAPDLAPTGLSGVSYCSGSYCGSLWSDYAYGADHTITK